MRSVIECWRNVLVTSRSFFFSKSNKRRDRNSDNYRTENNSLRAELCNCFKDEEINLSLAAKIAELDLATQITLSKCFELASSRSPWRSLHFGIRFVMRKFADSCNTPYFGFWVGDDRPNCLADNSRKRREFAKLDGFSGHFATEILLQSNWSEKTFDRAFKELSIDVQVNEIRLITNQLIWIERVAHWKTSDGATSFWFVVDWPVITWPDGIGLKRTLIEHSVGYRLMCKLMRFH